MAGKTTAKEHGRKFLLQKIHVLLLSYGFLKPKFLSVLRFKALFATKVEG